MQITMPSQESYWILFSTEDGNQNDHTKDPVDHAGLSLVRLLTQDMTYPQRHFEHTFYKG